MLYLLSLSLIAGISLRVPQCQAKMVGRVRLELTTNSLKGYCSTIELPTRIQVSGVAAYAVTVGSSSPHIPLGKSAALSSLELSALFFPTLTKFWTRRSESNRRVRDLQSPALPLGYSAERITSRNSHCNPHPCRNQH